MKWQVSIPDLAWSKGQRKGVSEVGARSCNNWRPHFGPRRCREGAARCKMPQPDFTPFWEKGEKRLRVCISGDEHSCLRNQHIRQLIPTVRASTLGQRLNIEECKPALHSLPSAPDGKQRHGAWLPSLTLYSRPLPPPTFWN